MCEFAWGFVYVCAYVCVLFLFSNTMNLKCSCSVQAIQSRFNWGRGVATLGKNVSYVYEGNILEGSHVFGKFSGSSWIIKKISVIEFGSFLFPGNNAIFEKDQFLLSYKSVQRILRSEILFEKITFDIYFLSEFFLHKKS